MANIVNLSGLATEIGSIISMYSKNVTDETEQWLKTTAKETVENVKKNAQSAGFKTDAKYIDGWTSKKVNGIYTVYNKNKPGMVHLLENGHEIVVHGISTGKKTRAFPHVKPAEEQIQEMVNELERALEGIK